MDFLRNLLASIIGGFIVLGVSFLLFFIIMGSIASTISDVEKITIEKGTVLEITLNKPVKDYAPKSSDPFDEILGLNDDRVGLYSLLNAIENAKTDERIEGISIHLMGVNAGLAQTQTLRKKLAEFKQTGKFIYAYADYYDQLSYYLSSVADSVFVNPMGGIDFKGLTSEVLFFKDLEDKSGFSMEVVRHGKYKSAVEPFLYNEMSEENRMQITSFLTSIWEEMLTEIAVTRNSSLEKLNDIADNLLARNATLALENKMIDGVLYEDEYDAKIKDELGVASFSTYNKVTLQDYVNTGKGRILASSSNDIAVIFAQGDIIYGEGNEDFIGQNIIKKAIEKALSRNSTKAIVLRINSPGGSALASELIWREIENAKAEVPIVVSMGNYAASGGYYIACNADKIFAEPTTITGSIGVFGLLPNAHKLASNIGINAEQVSTNKSPYYSVFEPISEEFTKVTQEGIEEVYTTFLERVADGRNKSTEEIDAIAQGRVWSGIEAKEIGLVDELGTLEDAVLYAAELAEISDYKLKTYPRYEFDFEDRFSSFPFGATKEQLLEKELGNFYAIYKSLFSMYSVDGIQAKMPYVLTIQ